MRALSHAASSGESARAIGAELPSRLFVPGSQGTATLATHLAHYGPISSPARVEERVALIEEVRSAGLLGRGGAAFPTARKIAAVVERGGVPVVVANGTEGEPASVKDKVLLTRSPQLVLDGAILAAGAIAAREVFVVVNSAVREIVDEALAERRSQRLDRVRVRIETAAPGFVAGEASAVVNWLEGGAPVPRATPPRLAERGLRGRPTLVHNVETLAHLALIARYGSQWFRRIGTEDEPGSMLITAVGAIRRSGVYESAIGAPVGEVLARAGGASAPLRAFLFGGYFGRWVLAEKALERPLSNAGLAPIGGGSGAGLVVALPREACGLRETANVVRYLAGESAGQCGPCLFGLPALASEFESIATGRPYDPRRLERWLAQVEGRGACSHPDGVVRLIRSALTVFSDEVVLHRDGWCSASGMGESVIPIPSRVTR